MAKLLTRRQFVIGAAAAGALSGCERHPVSRFLDAMQAWNRHGEAFMFSPPRLAPELPPSAETPRDAFPAYYVSNSLPMAPANWMLSVGGMVERPLTLTLAQIQQLPRTAMRVQHHCVEGWSAVASWTGVRVSEIARLVRPDPQVRFVEFRSFDEGYWSAWDLASALHPQTLIAYGFDGEPLMADHGAPVRVYSAVKLGYKNTKYLTEINFLSMNTGGYWEDQGYDWFAGV